MNVHEYIGFMKEATPMPLAQLGSRAIAKARTVATTGAKLVKSKAPSRWGRAALIGGAAAGIGAAGAVAGLNTAKALQRQEPLAPGSLEKEKRRYLADRFGNY